MRFRSAWWIDAVIFLAFIGLAYGLVGAASRWTRPLTPSEPIDLSPWSLPRYAGLSTLRIAVAYVLPSSSASPTRGSRFRTGRRSAS
jgi:hypothetical protein